MALSYRCEAINRVRTTLCNFLDNKSNINPFLTFDYFTKMSPADNKTKAVADKGSWHTMQCTGPGRSAQADQCVARVQIWLPTDIPRNFLNRDIYCGFCAASTSKNTEKSVKKLDNKQNFFENEQVVLSKSHTKQMKAVDNDLKTVKADISHQRMQREWQSKRNNVIIYGMEPLSSGTKFEKVSYDMEVIKEVFKSVDAPETAIVYVRRILTGNQPVICAVNSALVKSRLIDESFSNNGINVSFGDTSFTLTVKQDRTKSERDVRAKKRDKNKKKDSIDRGSKKSSEENTESEDEEATDESREDAASNTRSKSQVNRGKFRRGRGK